jgi:hypothetical protein
MTPDLSEGSVFEVNRWKPINREENWRMLHKQIYNEEYYGNDPNDARRNGQSE